jgi:hypothetical protein
MINPEKLDKNSYEVLQALSAGVVVLHPSIVNKQVKEMAGQLCAANDVIKQLHHQLTTLGTLLEDKRGEAEHLSLKDMAMVGIIEQCPKCAEAMKAHWVAKQEFAMAEHWRDVVAKAREGKKT